MLRLLSLGMFSRTIFYITCISFVSVGAIRQKCTTSECHEVTEAHLCMNQDNIYNYSIIECYHWKIIIINFKVILSTITACKIIIKMSIKKIAWAEFDQVKGLRIAYGGITPGTACSCLSLYQGLSSHFWHRHEARLLLTV